MPTSVFPRKISGPSPYLYEVEISRALQFKETEVKQINAAQVISKNPVNIERLDKIKAAIEKYSAGVEELAKVQTEIFVMTDKRTEISSEWAAVFAAQMQSPVLVELANRQEVETLLLQATERVC